MAEEFRRSRTSIHCSRPDQHSTRIAVTSSLPGEGKTTSAICLARYAALAGARVILVDCDLRRRASSMQFNPLKSIGLAKLLEGKGTLEDAVILEEAAGQSGLPERGEENSRGGMAESTQGGGLLQEERDLFDLEVLHTLPVLPVDDRRVMSA